jgi:hypothetical protein
MAIIGTLGAVFFLLVMKLRQPKTKKILVPTASSEAQDQWQSDNTAFNKKRETWFQKHTDPVFGRPVNDAFYWGEGRTENGKVIPRPYRYEVPFRHLKSGRVKVTADQFPLEQQKEMFLWLEEKMDAIGKLVPNLLLHSSEDDLEHGAAFYGVPSSDHAEVAFKPEYITGISLHGSEPVRWIVHFYAGNVDQDVYGRIEGEDEAVQYASLYM